MGENEIIQQLLQWQAINGKNDPLYAWQNQGTATDRAFLTDEMDAAFLAANPQFAVAPEGASRGEQAEWRQNRSAALSDWMAQQGYSQQYSRGPDNFNLTQIVDRDGNALNTTYGNGQPSLNSNDYANAVATLGSVFAPGISGLYAGAGLTAAQAAAAAGATIGGVSGGIRDGLDGALKGAALGGAGGYAGSMIGDALGQYINPSAAGGNLNMAAIESGLGTPGYGFNASAAQSGFFDPNMIGLGANETFATQFPEAFPDLASTAQTLPVAPPAPEVTTDLLGTAVGGSLPPAEVFAPADQVIDVTGSRLPAADPTKTLLNTLGGIGLGAATVGALAPSGVAPVEQLQLPKTPTAAQPPGRELSLLEQASLATGGLIPNNAKDLIGAGATLAGAGGLLGNAGGGASGGAAGAPGGTGDTLADRQFQQMMQLLDKQTLANRPNQIGSDGSTSTWTIDPVTGQWTNKVALNATQTATQAAQQQATLDRTQLATGLMGQLRDNFSQPFKPNSLQSYLPQRTNTDTSGLSAGQLNTNFGQFNSTADPVNTQFGQFNSTAPAVNTNFGQFQNTAGRVNTDFGQFTNAAPAVSTDFGQFNYTGPAQLTGFTPFTGGASFDTSAMGFQRSGTTQGLIQDVLQSGGYTAGVQDVNQDVAGNLAGVGRVNQVAPQFSNEMVDRYAKAAYEGQMALMRGDLENNENSIRNRLALQGLTPGTEASNRALSSFENARAAQLNALSNTSLLTGNTMANQDYSSMLAGFNAQNEAQNQAFGQGITTFNTNNSARTQALSNALSKYQADLAGRDSANAARNMAFNQDATMSNFALQAQAQSNAARNMAFNAQLGAYGANLNGINTANGARQAQFGNELNSFNANQNSTQARNAAQNQIFSQGATAFNMNQAAQERGNAAQAQQFGQDANSFNMNQAAQANSNAAQNQVFNQGATSFNMNQAAQERGNAAQGQQFAQGLQSFSANQAAQQNSNAALTQALNNNLGIFQAGNQAQNQAFNQGVQQYGIDYTAANAARNQPLMDMNSLLSGTGVSAPNFNPFVNAQNSAASPNLLGGAQLDIANQQTANQNQQASNSLWGNLLGAGLQLWAGKP